MMTTRDTKPEDTAALEVKLMAMLPGFRHGVQWRVRMLDGQIAWVCQDPYVWQRCGKGWEVTYCPFPEEVVSTESEDETS
jgi:hypothetical protein